MNWLGEPTRSTLGGIPMLQCWADLVLWEHVLNLQPYASVLELGTYKGAFALFLKMQCDARRIAFWTFDAFDLLETEVVRPHFVCGNIFHGDAVARHMASPCLLFCDNGNKPREVALFAPLLKPGDVLGAHDWGNEFTQEHLPDMPLEPLFHQEAAQLGITRFWQRR